MRTCFEHFFMTKFNFSKTNSSPEIPSWKIKLMQSKQKTLITIIWIFIMILAAAAAAVVVFLLLNIFSHIQANFFMTSLLLKLLTPFIIFFVWWVLICVDVALRCRIIFFIVDKMERKQMKFVKGWNFFWKLNFSKFFKSHRNLILIRKKSIPWKPNPPTTKRILNPFCVITHEAVYQMLTIKSCIRTRKICRNWSSQFAYLKALFTDHKTINLIRLLDVVNDGFFFYCWRLDFA